MADLLPENVTLADLVASGRLSNQKRYLRLALANTLAAEEWGTVSLRIGRTGTGTWPHYALERGGEIVARFDGQTHQSWPGASAHHEERWSSTLMRGADLHELWQKVTSHA